MARVQGSRVKRGICDAAVGGVDQEAPSESVLAGDLIVADAIYLSWLNSMFVRGVADKNIASLLLQAVRVQTKAVLESVASASVHRALVLLNLLAGMLSVQLPFAILGIGTPFGGGEALWAAMCLATDDVNRNVGAGRRGARAQC